MLTQQAPPPPAVTKPAATPDRAELAAAAPVAPPPAASAVRSNPVIAPAVTRPAPAAPSPIVSPQVVRVLIARGDELLATGDVNAARLMYQRAATADSAEGAVAMGMTYDPRVLANIGVRGLVGDPQRAVTWYKRASDLGSPDGPRLIAQLQAAAR